jgi:predicted ATP-grasp superfamily ATP-dependent carboligase
VRVLIYEFVVGGGRYAQSADAAQPPAESLAREGRAMLAALVADFAASGAEVETLWDVRAAPLEQPGVTVHPIASAEEERRSLARLAARADWTVLIAPEFDGHLLARARVVEQAGGRLLGPSSQLVALAGDKQATAEHLARHGVRVPRGIALAAGEALPGDFDYPAVLKPRDGAGSLGVERIERRSEARTVETPSRLEAYCPGMAASVACLCGPGQVVPLAPCRQKLVGGGNFAYQGGSLPLDRALAQRAQGLASRAVGSLPRPLGYLGVDLVLGDEAAGGGDVVVEINPRLTTSYAGLRALARNNLAEAMVRVACGAAIELCWNPGEVHFTSAGELGRRPDYP